MLTSRDLALLTVLSWRPEAARCSATFRINKRKLSILSVSAIFCSIDLSFATGLAVIDPGTTCNLKRTQAGIFSRLRRMSSNGIEEPDSPPALSDATAAILQEFLKKQAVAEEAAADDPFAENWQLSQACTSE